MFLTSGKVKYSESFLFLDDFEFSRTKPRSRHARDVSSVGEVVAQASHGSAIIYIAMASVVCIILSATLALYLYTNNRKLRFKTTSMSANEKTAQNVC